MGTTLNSSNFGFLKYLDPSLVTLGAQAELLFIIDAPACIGKLRLLGERLAKELAAHAGMRVDERENQKDLIQTTNRHRSCSNVSAPNGRRPGC